MSLIETIQNVISDRYPSDMESENACHAFEAMSEDLRTHINNFFTHLFKCSFSDLLKLSEAKIAQRIHISWAIEDVQEIRPDLSDEQAAHVLNILKNKYDSNIGINWEVIEIVAEREYGSPIEDEDPDND